MIEIPPQSYNTQSTKALEATATTTKEAFKFWVLVQIVIQPFILMSLSMMWGLINSVQIVAYLMLFNIPIPANVLVVNKVFYEIATFDMIDLEWLEAYLDDWVGEYDQNNDVYLSA